jgi:hypothetical protein
MLLHHTLKKWGHPELAPTGATVLTELLDQAVKHTGVPDPTARWRDRDDLALIGVRLLLFDMVGEAYQDDGQARGVAPSGRDRRGSECPVDGFDTHHSTAADNAYNSAAAASVSPIVPVRRRRLTWLAIHW